MSIPKSEIRAVVEQTLLETLDQIVTEDEIAEAAAQVADRMEEQFSDIYEDADADETPPAGDGYDDET